MDIDQVFREIENSGDTAYVLSSDLRITRMNRAWSTFAHDNEGEAVLARWGVGCCLVDALPEPLRDFYVRGFAHALRTGTVWEHDYECSSPTLLRRFRMFAFPEAHNAILVQHARRVEIPHPASPHAPEVRDYEDAFGIVSVCANCRRVRNRKQLGSLGLGPRLGRATAPAHDAWAVRCVLGVSPRRRVTIAVPARAPPSRSPTRSHLAPTSRMA